MNLRRIAKPVRATAVFVFLVVQNPYLDPWITQNGQVGREICGAKAWGRQGPGWLPGPCHDVTNGWRTSTWV